MTDSRDRPPPLLDRDAGDAAEIARLERDLREAWPGPGFSLEYQPQVDLRTQRVTAFEALIRWRHPERGEVPPAIFIPIAEEIGLVNAIGRWVVEQACRDAATWPEHIGIAVNVSAVQLNDPGLPGIVAAALEAVDMMPSRLELEVTETARMLGDATCIAVLHALRDTGIRIAMDDFDNGYSELGYLLKFPFDKIKIDRSFIDRLPESEDRHAAARAIVRAIVNLCGELGIVALAEGVETQEQLALLAAAQCPLVQGYLFGKPVPARHVAAMLRSASNLLFGLDTSGGVERPAALSAPGGIPFFQICETANDIVIVTTAQLEAPGPVIVYVNPAFTRLTGYTAAETIGRTPRILQGPGTSRKTLDAIRAGLSAGRTVHEKVLNFAKSGAPYWLDVQIVPLHDAVGTVTHFAAIQRDVTLDKRRLDELEYLSDRDTLTGIPNRVAFEGALAAETAGAVPPATVAGRTACVAVIDIDHFRRLNERLGHACGDAMLWGMVSCLAENIRRRDVFGRLEGGQLAICMPAITLQDAKGIAERLRGVVANTRFETPAGPVGVTISIGVAAFVQGDTPAMLLERAGVALGHAKQAGRNRVRSNPARFRTAGV